MKAIRVRTIDMVRRIRDRHARQLAGKTDAEIIAFYRAAGEADDLAPGTLNSILKQAGLKK